MVKVLQKREVDMNEAYEEGTKVGLLAFYASDEYEAYEKK